MKKLFLGVATAAVLVSGLAYADAIADRKALMKANGAAMGVLAKSVKGEMTYDAAAVLAAFQSLNNTAKNFGNHFPAGSETGGETKASPKIWQDMDGFKAKLAKFTADTEAAIAAAPANKEALGAVFGPVGSNCQGCHEAYRLPMN